MRKVFVCCTKKLSIALALTIVLVSLMSSDSTANAEQQFRYSFDTGVIAPGENQIVRVTINWGDGAPAGVVRFRRREYTPGVCSGGVCKQTIASQTTTNPVMLMSGEAASIDIPASFSGGVFVGAGAVVESSRRDAVVTIQIIDEATGQVNSILIALLLP